MSNSDDIAVVGFSFKLPQGVDDDAAFWEMLQGRRNMRTGWPKSRINVDAFTNSKHHKFQGKSAHFISDDPTVFDAPFFSVTAKEAASMDPMQRWTLEASYHAFENAGIPAESLSGSRTAVFSASMEEDYTRMVSMDPENVERTAVTGSTVNSIIPNRVSWYFDMHGPSVHVNTACSSALGAFDLAYKTLQMGDASCALVTGCNLLLDPGIFQLLSDQNFLSPDGVCHSFDHRANGYARGEGVLAVVLKPVCDAVRDGDMIRAVIRGTGSNQDGQTPVMTQPSQKAQEDLIRHVYKQAKLPLDVTRYVEAHGTGTPTGDPVEMKAIGRVFRESRSAEEPLYVGTVKANVGHLEGASALAGIIKSILILEKGIVPPNPLFEKLNPAIDADFYRTVVPTQSVNWPSQGLRRISINSFGFGGSNTHVIIDDAYHYLQERGLTGNHCTTQVPGAPIEDVVPQSNGHVTNGHVNGHTNGHTNGGTKDTNGSAELTKASKTALPTLLVWSAADEKAVNRVTQGYESFFHSKVAGSPAKLDQLAFTLSTRRSQMLWRTFAIVVDGPVGSGTKTLSPAKPIRSAAQAGLAYVFTGQGAQYVDMGRELIQYPVFAHTLGQIDDIYCKLGCEWTILDELRRAENINEPQYSQPLSTAVQIGLIELLKSFNLSPKGVMGHSSGEIAAAYAIGALSLESACKASYFRGQLAGKLKQDSTLSPGAMMSINLARDQVAAYLKDIKGVDATQLVCVACINSPLNCTLSGLETAIDLVKVQADKDGIFAQKLKTGVGYHSPSMLAIADEYRTKMGTLSGEYGGDLKSTTQIPMVSSVSGKVINPAVLATAQYWVDNMVSPVQFSEALQLLTQEVPGLTDLVEIGPHPALKRPVLDTLGQANKTKQIRYANVLHRSKPASEAMLELVGSLFCLGHGISISAVNQQQTDSLPRFLVDCPKYPFNHSQKYWAESRISRDFRLRENVRGDTLGVRSSDWNPLYPRWRRFLSLETDPWIGDHRISGTALFPGAGMIVMAIEAVQQTVPDNRTVAGFLLKKAEFISPIIVKDTWEERTEVEMHLRPLKGQSNMQDATWFEATILSYLEERWTECFRASIQVEYQVPSQANANKERELTHKNVRDHHDQLTRSCVQPIDPVVLYHESYKHGLQFGEWFQTAQDVYFDGQASVVGRVDVSKVKYQTKSLVHPAVVDTAFMILRASAGQQPASNVPIQLSEAWFAASGWQHPTTNSVRWCATSTSALCGAQAAGYGEQGTLAALADDGTVLCTIGKAITAAVAISKDNDKKLLYNVEWKPQLSMLEPEQLTSICHADYTPPDESSEVKNQARLCHALDLVSARTLKHLDRARVPDNLRRHLEWLEYKTGKMPAEERQQGEDMSDADVEAMLAEVDVVLPSWKLYTECARKLPTIMAGELDPLSVLYTGGLADRFYADFFQKFCADSRFATLLDLASHENPSMRILEVGAGTGGTTVHVIARLQEREKRTGAPSFAEYNFTDISPMFFERASGRWPQLQGRMKFKTLDLGQDIEKQGFEPGSYDIVIAGSVLHAAPYLEPNIRNVRKALKPGGRLILLEIVNPEDHRTNSMAGLLPGFWVAQEEWRPHSPAVTEDVWNKLLRANGFSGNDLVIRDHESDECHVSSIIVSTALEEEQEAPILNSRLVLVTDETQSDAQKKLAGSITSQIDPLGNRNVSICAFTLDQLKSTLADLSSNDVVVCLAEVNNKPLLADLSEEHFASLKYLVGQAPKLLWATGTSTTDEQYASYGILQGFFRSIRAEQPDSHMVTVAIEGEDNERASYFIAKTFKTVFGSQSSPEVEFVVRNGAIMTGRAAEFVSGNDSLRSLLSQQSQEKPWGEAPALQLTTGAQNSVDSLQFVQDVAYDTGLTPHEVEIEAKAWGLSERDLHTAVSRAENHQKILGTDCAGIVIRVGSSCESIQVGDRVCMVSLGCMRKYPRAAETSVVMIPRDLPFDVAASVLIPALTAYRALIDVARVDEGETVLIHSAADGVGQLAVQIAKMKGAEIFATVSSHEEKQFLVDTLGLKADRIFPSSDTSFSKAVLRITNGAGVDVVVNSLPGSNELQASFECTAHHGRFIEIGRANIEANATIPMAMFARDIAFSPVDVVNLPPKVTARLMKDTMQLLEQAKIQHPQSLRVFNVSEIKQAFKHVQSGSKNGRVVICPRSEDTIQLLIQERRSWTFDANASYLIAGGSGGLGRAIIQWMADRGAKHLIIPSRSGASSKSAREMLEELKARGVNAIAPQCDVSSESSLASTLEECRRSMPPIKGCINGAVVLQDAVFQQSMTFAQWDLTIRSKVRTALNLHRQLPNDLDFFILLSSIAGVNGQMGSANYAGGCSSQDALASCRVANGKRALSVNIGWMRNIGVIAESGQYQRQRQEANDMNQVDDTELLGFMTLACDPASPLGVSQAILGARTPAEALAEGQKPPALLERPLWANFSFLVGSDAAGGDAGTKQLAPDQAAGTLFRQARDTEERTQVVLRALAAKLARAMSISPGDVVTNKPLSSYGVDSLMAVEMRNWINREFGASIPVFKIMGGTPISDIADVVVAKSRVGKEGQ